MTARMYGPVRSCLAWSALTQWTFLLAPTAIASAAFDGGHIGWQMARNLWSTAWLRLFGQRLRVYGAENLDPTRPAVYVANHQSFLDVPAIFRALPLNLRFLCKQSLRYYPAIGQYLVATGHVFVDRSDRESARRSMADAAQRVREGTPILIFPEGTRTRDGSLQPFKKGAFVLAIEAGVPLVPIAVRGSFEGLGRRLRPRPGLIEVHVGDPLPTAGLGYDDRETLRDQAHAALRRLLRDGRQQAHA